jgi:hypothetical protein
MHIPRVGHDTEPSRLCRGAGLGVRWKTHLTPFQRAARVLKMLLLPTAVQFLADTHDTPLYSASCPVRTGSVITLDPVQSRDRSLLPTAMQPRDELHEMAVHPPNRRALSTVHRWPSQRSS